MLKNQQTKSLSEPSQPDDQQLDPATGLAYASELRGMIDRSFILTERYKGQQTRCLRAGCHPQIIEFERKLVKKMAKLGVPMFCHSMMRDGDEQNRLFVQGYSNARSGQSPHNYGLACDIVHSTKAWELTRKQWELVGHVGKELAAALGIPISWGGEWEYYDPAHWEMQNWRDIGTSFKNRYD